MNPTRSVACFVALWLVCLAGMHAQQTAVTAVPRLVNFSGKAVDSQGKTIAGVAGATFAIYRDQTGGAPLWLETQNVTTDSKGNFTAQLGATESDGLPLDLFTSGEARWLGVSINNAEEQRRVLLLSVPYALKAADAETVGGLPPSAFVLATPASVPSQTAPSSAANQAAPNAAPPAGTVGGSGTANFIPLWTDNADIGSSIIFQSGTGAAAKIGINTTTPVASLDVKGGSTLRGLVALPSVTVATAAKGSNSQPLAMTASSFNSTLNAAVNQNFRWQAEPSGNDTATPSATLNLLFNSGNGAPIETGLKLSGQGLVTFATGQTFPGTGTIFGVTAGTGLTGGGSTGSVTLNIDTTKVPQLNTANNFTASQSVTGNVIATGTVTGGAVNASTSFNLGGSAFAFGSFGSSNAFIGFSGNSAVTGTGNVGVGSGAFTFNTTGSNNAAIGINALVNNTTGSSNTAAGGGALFLNTTGGNNSASGNLALGNNTTGSNNTALGYNAGPDSAHPNLTNAAAIGANAVVSASNALVLGGTGANAVSVGIGTATPASTLDVHGTGNFTGLITFAAGQTFPGAGTITGVTAGTGLTGGGSTGGVTLNVDTTKVVTGVTAGTGLTGGGTGGVQTLNIDTTKIPQLSAANTFNNSQTVNGNLTATGAVIASMFDIGGSLFAFGNFSQENAFLGFSGSTTASGNNNTATGISSLASLTSGSNNTATGAFALAINSNGLANVANGQQALYSNSTGDYNTAIGTNALFSNTTSSNNTATGYQALLFSTIGFSNTANGEQSLFNTTTGDSNTATGQQALYSNTTGRGNTANGMTALYYSSGSYNSALGYTAGPDHTTPSLTNSTAIGAFADVSVSNAMVLGSINGVNGAGASTNVGIGTTAPVSTLDVESTGAGLVAPVLLLKNNAAVQSGTFGNSVDFRFALDGGSSVSNPNAYIRAAEDGNGQYGSFISLATIADGGSGSGAMERMRIASNGDVGIAVTSPTHIFQVGQGAGAAFADSWSTYSSRRWKTNVQTLSDALAKVRQLRGVSYDLKDSGKHEIGVIAEEVGQVVPEVVSFEENGKDAQGVDYSRLTALLIEAVKAQQKQITLQAASERKQQAEIQSLKSQLRETRRGLMKIKMRMENNTVQPILVAGK